jgi:acyl carrier protein
VSDVTQRVLELARQRFPKAPGELTPDADLFAALGIDSVQALDLLSALERELGVELPDYELLEVRTLRELAERIEERL